MVRLTHYKVVPAGGMLLGIVMLALFAWQPGGLSLWQVCALLAVGGSGLGVMYPVTTTIVQNAVRAAPARHRDRRAELRPPARRRDHRRGVRSDRAGRHRHRRAWPDARHAARRRAWRRADFAAVFRFVFAAGAVFLALGLIAVVAIEERPLRGPAQVRGARSGIADTQRRALIFGRLRRDVALQHETDDFAPSRHCCWAFPHHEFFPSRQPGAGPRQAERAEPPRAWLAARRSEERDAAPPPPRRRSRRAEPCRTPRSARSSSG